MSENVETAYLEESDPNFDSELQILIHRHCETIIDKVKEFTAPLRAKRNERNKKQVAKRIGEFIKAKKQGTLCNLLLSFLRTFYIL